MAADEPLAPFPLICMTEGTFIIDTPWSIDLKTLESEKIYQFLY
jgi:hypothetical protein